MKFTILVILLVCFFIGIRPAGAIDSKVTTNSINQKICDRFEQDLNKMAAIMDELKRRKDIKETRVAFGGVDTPIESADYWINFAAEAVAYQRAQMYGNNVQLKASLETLKGKILRAKTEVGKALDE